jgi:hypothetical protein
VSIVDKGGKKDGKQKRGGVDEKGGVDQGR